MRAEYAAQGVEFTRGLANMPWHSREFVVKDCDGRLLAKSAQAFAMRARIVLACAEGLSNGAATRKLHLTGAVHRLDAAHLYRLVFTGS